jgi:hypothetical protein
MDRVALKECVCLIAFLSTRIHATFYIRFVNAPHSTHIFNLVGSSSFYGRSVSSYFFFLTKKSNKKSQEPNMLRDAHAEARPRLAQALARLLLAIWFRRGD